MADDTSIFGILQPQPEDRSLRGLFSSSLKDISNMFQGAIPNLLSDPDIGVGESFAAGLLGGFGAPARRREAAREGQEQTARQLLNALPGLLPRMDRESQTRVLQQLFPDAQAAVPAAEEDAATKELRSKMLNTFLDTDAPRELRERARDVYAEITPHAADAARSFILSMPEMEDEDVTPEITGAFINGLLADYTESSVSKYLDEVAKGNRDENNLTPKPDSRRNPTKVRAEQLSSAINKIRAEQERVLREEEKSISIREAGERAGMPQVDILAVEKEMGVPVSTTGALTTGKLYQIAERRAVDLTPNLEWEKYALGDYSEETMTQVRNRARQVYDVMLESARQSGLTVYEAVPSLRSGAVPLGAEVDYSRVADEVNRRLAAGDTRPYEEIVIEVADELGLE